MFVVGATGTGKSTLARELLQRYKSVVAIDPIHTLGADLPCGHLPGYKLVRTPEALSYWGRWHKLLQYRPDPAYQEWTDYDRVFEWLFRRKDVMVYIDEGLRVVRPSGMASVWLNGLMTAGRGRGIGMIICTQRPAGIDPRMLTEAEHYVCFRLRRKVDRQRMAEVMGETVITHPARDHSFWHLADGAERPRLFSLVLDPR